MRILISCGTPRHCRRIARAKRRQCCGCALIGPSFAAVRFKTPHSADARLAADWLPVAIRWSGDPATAGRRVAPPPGDMLIDNCVFFGVDAAIECRPERAPSIEFRQTLDLLSGPLVRLGGMPRADQAVTVILANTTVRASTAVVECRWDAKGPPEPSSRQFGPLTVAATDSVFALDSSSALLLLTGGEPTPALLAQFDWSGQGSLVTPEAVMLAWRSDADGVPKPLGEDTVAVGGLVRSPLEFAGDASAGPAGTKIRHWQAPLRSSETPGVGPGRLMLPNVGPLADQAESPKRS